MPSSQNNKNKRRKNKRKQNKNTSAVMKLPQIQLNPTFSQTARYSGAINVTAGAESVISIAAQDIMRAAGVIASSGSTAYAIAQAFKLVKVTLICAPALTTSLVAPTTVGLVWFNGNGRSKSSVISDTSLNVSVPARVDTRPPRRTFSDLWYESSQTDVMFDIVVTGLTGTYLLIADVHIKWVSSNQSLSALPVTVAGTMTIGDAYYTPLDGVSSHVLLRQGLPSIF